LSILRKVLCYFLAVGLLLAFPGFASADETDKFIQVKSGKFSRVFVSPDFEKDQTVFAFEPQGGDSHWTGHTNLYRSQDGGKNWTRLDWVVDEYHKYYGDIWLSDLAFGPDGTLYITGVYTDSDDDEWKAFFYESEENGDRWEKLTEDIGDDYLLQIAVLNENKMLAVDNRGILRLSKNGGRDWHDQIKGMLSAEYGSLAVVDENTYVVVQEDGTLQRTSNGGQVWDPAGLRLISGSYYHGQVIPVPHEQGFSLLAFGAKEGDMHVGGSDFRWKKVDKENLKWSEYTSSRLTCATAVSDGIILAGTPRDLVLVTEDGGDFWFPIREGLDGQVYDLSALRMGDEVVVFAATDRGLYRMDYHPAPAAPPQEEEQPEDEDEPEQPDIDEQPEPEQPDTGDVKFFIGLTKYMVGDELHHMDARPFIEKDRTYVPVRYLALSLGIPEEDIRWNDEKKEVTLVKDGSTLSLTVGKYIMYLDGFPRGTPVAPVIRGDRTYLPARFVVEAFDYEAAWDQTERTVTVSKKTGN
jgi:photosystem II stability/assembly factor-like uncharacterized protein